MRHTVEGYAASDHVRITSEPLLPKTFCDQRDIRALLFLRPKIPAENWTDPKHIEVVRSYSSPKNLDRIAGSGQCEEKWILGSKTVKKRLSFTIMLKTRRGDRDIDKIARLVAGEHVDNARWVFEWQPAQKKIVDQAEDRRVKADPERKRDHG